MEPQYRILELSTTGWVDWDKNAPSMTKEDCSDLYQELLSDGVNPRELKIYRVS